MIPDHRHPDFDETIRISPVNIVEQFAQSVTRHWTQSVKRIVQFADDPAQKNYFTGQRDAFAFILTLIGEESRVMITPSLSGNTEGI